MTIKYILCRLTDESIIIPSVYNLDSITELSKPDYASARLTQKQFEEYSK